MKKIMDKKCLGLLMVLSIMVTVIVQSTSSLVYANQTNSSYNTKKQNIVLPSTVNRVSNDNLKITPDEKSTAISEISKVRLDIQIDFDHQEQSQVILTNGEIITTLKFGLIGESINSNSYYQIYYNKFGNRLGTQAIVASYTEEGKISATMIENGLLTFKVNETDNGNVLKKNTNNRWEVVKEQRGPAKDWIACFSNCLSGAGLASWLVTLILAACTGACVVTAGVACIACAIGVSAVAGATAGSCSAQCS